MVEDTITFKIIKWAAIVFAAGFVGYFGRYLSMQILAKLHKKKEEKPVSKYDYKLQKKKAKAEKKRLKSLKKKR